MITMLRKLRRARTHRMQIQRGLALVANAGSPIGDRFGLAAGPFTTHGERCRCFGCK